MPLTTTSVKNHIKYRLGEPKLPIDEMDDLQYDSAIEEALRVYNRNLPVVKQDMLTLVAGQRTYLIPSNKRGRGLITCAVPPSKYRFGLGWGFGDEFSVFDSSVVRDIQHYAISVEYYKTARKVLSAQFSWSYDLETGQLMITPAPQEGLQLWYRYVDNRTLDQVPFRDEDWILAYSLAEVKEMVGQSRALLSDVPGNQTTIQLNGAQLLQEAQASKEALMADLRQRVGGRFLLPVRDS